MAQDAVAAPDGLIPGVKGDGKGDPLTATNCTSQDVKVARTNLISYRLGDVNGNFSGSPIPYTGQSVTCTTGQQVELTLTAELDETATSARTDIGIWIATDGGDAITGRCNHYNLVNGGTGVSNTDGDSCGDLAAGAVVTGFQLGTIVTTCQVDPTPVAGQDPSQLHVGSCLGWKEPGADTVCPMPAPAGTADGASGFRWGTLYGNQAKCNCDGFNVNITVLQSAFLEVQKVCAPTTDAGKFNLQIDATTQAADAACGGTTGKQTVGAGDTQNPGASHSFGETAGTGTSLSNYTSTRECHNRTGTPGDRLTSASGTGGSLTFQPNDDVVCTITNTRKGSITITKVTQPGSDPQDFAFTTSGTGLSSFTLDTDGSDATFDNTKTFTGLTPGSYTVTEGATTGWDLTDITCVDPTSNSSGVIATGVATINIAAGESVSCTYTNRKKGTVIIKKETDPDAVAGSFGFTQNVDGSGSFNLSDGGSKTFSNVTPTTTGYTVTEGSTTGFSLKTLACDNPVTGNASTTSGAVATIRVDPGETVTCTYTNLQLATLVLAKVENGGLPLSRAWSFELRTGASTSAAGTVVSSASANVTTGVVQFSGYFTPGAYQLCETGMPAGYNNNFTGFTPLGATPEGGDNSTECINITLASGANGPSGITGIPNPINNIPPPQTSNGGARTIGYWKNWSSCTGGQQYTKAAARNELNKTLDFYLPANSGLYPIGDITSATPLNCTQAVRLLGKSDMSSGKKLASDPAYNLVAQFIAAKLNYLVGAGQCSAATTAIANAQTLLDAINFVGTGTYANKMTAAQQTQANQLAATLDAYNNNQLCP